MAVKAIDTKIAVVGVSCRFPGSFDPESYWESLANQEDSVVEVPESRWPVSEYYSETPHKNRSVSKWAGLVDGFDRFDASYFKILPREAELMDPQQRVCLELAVSCIEDAGYGVQDVKGSNLGVYLGVCNFDYKERLEKCLGDIQGHLSTGTYTALIPNRVSYFLDAKGPSVPVDTACSSSLVALSLAMQSIQNGECESALVGGVSYLFSHTYFVAFSQAGMLSPTGKCRTFDESADGYVRGEGAGMVLLKPLEKALADRDQVYGVIDSVAINHGGSVSTITSPSPYAQANVVKAAMQKANVPASSITYIEAHGTGTPKGDPIEINALKRGFRAYAQETGESLQSGVCALSSAKTNIGHLEAAAGIAGLIKGLISIRKKHLLPLIHFESLNPRIALDDSPFRIVREIERWDVEGSVRRFGLSSFGFGGVNAHAIVSEHIGGTELHQDQPSEMGLFPFSASSKTALRSYAFLLAHFLKKNPSARECDCGYTLARRTSLSQRIVFSYSTRAELIQKLVACANGIDPEVIQDFSIKSLGKSALDWVRGGKKSIWEIFSDLRHHLIHVPPYPFDQREHFPADLLSEFAPQKKGTDKDCLVEIYTDDVRREPLNLDKMDSVARAPIVIALVNGEFEQKLKMRIDPSRLILVSGIPDEGSNWLGWYKSFYKTIQKLLGRTESSHCVLLSDHQQELVSTLYAHALSFDKEYGFPCAWYRWEGELGQSVEEVVVSLLGKSVDKTFCKHIRLDGLGNPILYEEAVRVRPIKLGVTKAVFNETKKPTILLTGGAGGIGQVLAQYLANTYNARIYLLGRRSEEQLPERSLLSTNGSLRYIQADCIHQESLQNAVDKILSEAGGIDVVLHGAGQIRDKSLFFKTEQDIEDVAAGKVLGCSILDSLTAELPLTHFVVFSSITGLLGNPGQTDYAAANRFLSEFVEKRNRKTSVGERSGRAVAIHWPYWRDGGMQIDEALVAMLRETTGTEPLENEQGIAILEYALSKSVSQLCVTAGSKRSIEHALCGIELKQGNASAVSPSSTIDTVVAVVSEVSGLNVDAIDHEVRLSDIGIDSIAMQGIARELSQQFDVSVTSVTLSKYPSAKEIARYILSLSEDNTRQNELIDEKLGERKRRAERKQENGESCQEVGGCSIVGMSLKVSGSSEWREGWSYLSDKSVWPQSYPEERWSLLPAALKKGFKREKLRGYFLDSAFAFDNKFFGISRREAMLMDPQHRLLIEAVWSAITDAGYSPEEFSKRPTAVFVCLDATDYTVVAGHDAKIDEFTVFASASYLSANRLSHIFNLQGPSETVNVACASVYSAVDRAKFLIDSGVVEQAIVAAAQINLLPSRFEMLAQRQLISSDEVVAPFDESARGFLRSEGVGCLVLKNKSLAVEDHDEILANILSTATSHNGKNSSLTTPSALTNYSVIDAAFRKVSADPCRLRYVEAHGTASSVGDVSETDAILEFFDTRRVQDSCAVSSMKSNIGHLEVCSGIAAFARSILAIQRKQVPGIPEFETLNKSIDGRRLSIQNIPQDLPDPENVLVGLLAYGLGGVSSFVLLDPSSSFKEEGERARRDSDGKYQKSHWILLSADTEPSLERYVTTFLTDIERYQDQTEIGVLASTLRFHRSHRIHRLAVLASSFDQLQDNLIGYLSGEPHDRIFVSHPNKECRIDSSARSELPAYVVDWLDGLTKDSENVGKGPRCFWPQYPFDQKNRHFIAESKDRKEMAN